jgi:NADH-quinone oxidoreductase subunit I
MLRCIFCGYCEDACPTEAIQLGHEFQLSFTDRKDSIFVKDMLIDPVPASGKDVPQKTEPGKYDRSIPDMPDPK